MGNKCYYGFRNILGSELLRKDIKCKIYTTLFSPVVPYGCESRTLTKTIEGKLCTHKRKILRKIYGPRCVNGVCTTKYNDELYSLYKEPRIVKMNKTARMKWLGHSKDGA
jgi:hypothetical protein